MTTNATTTRKDTRLNIRITDEELDLLKKLANEKNMTLADWVRFKLLGHGDDNDLRNQVQALNDRLAILEARLLTSA
jgi:uncharacterized protein (DUF1778 family)